MRLIIELEAGESLKQDADALADWYRKRMAGAATDGEYVLIGEGAASRSYPAFTCRITGLRVIP